MKRVLRVLKLLILLMLFGGLFSCSKPEEYYTLKALELHSPWTYHDPNVLLKVDFKELKDTSTSINIFSTTESTDIKAKIKIEYSNKAIGLSFTEEIETESFHHSDVDAYLKTKAIDTGIYVHYHNENDIAFKFTHADLLSDPVTKAEYPSPVPFVQPLYRLKPGE